MNRPESRGDFGKPILEDFRFLPPVLRSVNGYKRLFSGVPSDFRCRSESRPSCPNVRILPNYGAEVQALFLCKGAIVARSIAGPSLIVTAGSFPADFFAAFFVLVFLLDSGAAVFPARFAAAAFFEGNPAINVFPELLRPILSASNLAPI